MSRTEFMCGEYAAAISRARESAMEVASNIEQAVLCLRCGDIEFGFFTGAMNGYAEQLNRIVASAQDAADNYYKSLKEKAV